MLLHGLDATKRGETATFIESQDTDVLLLMPWTYKRLCLNTTLTAETEGKGRSTPVGPLYEVDGEDLVKALPGNKMGMQPVPTTLPTSTFGRSAADPVCMKFACNTMGSTCRKQKL